VVVQPNGEKVVRVTGVEPGQKGPRKEVFAKNVITCAGFYADRVAQMGGGGPNPPISTFRGTYYQLKPEYKNLVKVNVYPVPSGGGIPVGVHFTPTVNEKRGHQMIVGPGACLTFSREGYKFWDISVRDLFDSLTNPGMWMFALKNPNLSIGELYRYALLVPRAGLPALASCELPRCAWLRAPCRSPSGHTRRVGGTPACPATHVQGPEQAGLPAVGAEADAHADGGDGGGELHRRDGAGV
jgi:hypothetical protein